MSWIIDATRPVTTWDVHDDTQVFLHEELNGLFKGYWRNLMQSQPNHIEIVGEKNTLSPVIRPVAAEYTIPLTLARGFSSLPPRAAIADRYEESGKEKLVLLIVSDFDPEGEEIAHSLARSMRDDFGIEAITPIKVALTHEQVARFELPPNTMAIKKKSTNYPRFAAKYGDTVYEVEALPHKVLQRVLREVIDSVIDTELFNAELDQEKQDAAMLASTHQRVRLALGGIVSTED